MKRIVCGTGDERLDEALASAEGVEVVATAYHPEAVLDAAARHESDAVLLSPRMLEGDWPLVVDGLRAAGRRIVWLAGCAADRLDRDQVRMLVAAGVYDLICDPFTVEDVVARLQKPMLPGQATALIDPPGTRRTTGLDLAAALDRFRGRVEESAARHAPATDQEGQRRERQPGLRLPKLPRRAAREPEPENEVGAFAPERPVEEPVAPEPRPDPRPRRRRAPAREDAGAVDALTGLPTRASGELLIARAIEEAEGRDGAVQVAFIDLDGFKQVNDTQGHRAGDQVLRRAAQALAGAVRESDTVIRWGGDEFLVILPGTDGEGAERALWRLRQAAGAASVSFSAGMAAWRPGDTVEALVERADREMYRDKERRRSGVLTAGLTVFLGALPGCGTSRAAIALAREEAAGGRDVLLVDAHAERAHLAHLMLGRHLDPLVPEDRVRSWRHARGAEGLRRAVVQVAPGLHLLPLAYDSDPWESLPPVGTAPDVAVRWLDQTVVEADLVCRRAYSPGDGVAVLQALARSGRTVRVRAVADGLSDADRRLWSDALGVLVADGHAKPAGPAVQLIAELTRALRVCSTVAPAAVVDLGAPRPLVGGVADPRVSWAARNAHVVVVTRGDALGEDAAERLLTTLRCEAERAGVDLAAEVYAADLGARQTPPVAV